MYFFILPFLLLFLFFLSRQIQKKIYTLFLLITRNKKASVAFLATILLPGTIIHELSHFFIATILRIPTGKISLTPTVEEDGEVHAGKLTLDDTDPFRMSIVGISPILIGLFLIYLIGQFFINSNSQQLTINNLFNLPPFLLFVIYYLLFVISITMFSSKKDLEKLVIAGPIIILIIISLYLVGFRFNLTKELFTKLDSIVFQIDSYMVITIMIDLLVLGWGIILISLLEKVFRIKVVSQ